MKSGRDHYADIYASQLDAEARWLSYGAIDKADSVESLVRPRAASTDTVMELGAGTGAIIQELQRRTFARQYVAVDYSPDACDYMRRNLTGAIIHQADIVTERIPHRANVVLLSHVIEHLEEPETLLSAIATNVKFDWIVIECPLEDLPASRFKNLFRNRLKNLAGHVQFFTPSSLRGLVGRFFEIVDYRHYAPWSPPEVVSFIAEKDRLSYWNYLVKRVTMEYGPRFFGPVWKRLWLGNYAMLCRAKQPLSQRLA